MKKLLVVFIFVVLAGCAKVNYTNGFAKDEILLKLTDTTVQTVLYQGVSGDGKPFFKYPTVTFMGVLQFSAPEVYKAAQETLGYEIFSYELRKYDLNNDNLITIEEFRGVLGETEFTDEAVNKFIRDFKREHVRDSAGFDRKGDKSNESSL